ncbi:Conserved oligomeric Golgi complex subunit 6 [Lasiodiplodia hormozganensis]|uniref:Conserved oligomeric Golgi complex subunit 6 n=2 Tax=Lasiodiplodia TaxID=66739 RepID=A0A5N5DEX3_9PEZI|nr:Component of oligomeric golgi complex 6 [Lasiodiplodia theobromae]KAB2575514.1 Conserved oligomeric Golgi complex subunit 6 [Lasiodiplodia theobromae]KAF4536362.1 Component of oligomeric golgi complex 6 [Lasiodiplodia theobromae]KAK0642461.1 Conserved oligomeric Golgi complex subunit 6 [Lasiodiplodia hormozganensis]
MSRPSLPSRPSGEFGDAALGGAPQRASALSTRISSVLSASYADLEIRDALETLDARGLKNTQDMRRQLRLDVQRDVIRCNGDIVQDFGRVAEQLRRVGTAIQALNRCCADMRAQISSANSETKPMLDEASTLMGQKADTEKKQRLLEALKSHFILSDEQLFTLTSTTEPVNDEFFQLLTRVKKIHHDSQLLLGTEDQRLGLEILEQSSKQLSSAFQKLYRWVQREFKSLDLENPQISASIRRALRVLAERPTLFQSCLDFFAEAREHTLSDAFYNALTGAAADVGSSTAKPIEFYAHDPLRYVGDMLAWVHSTTVSEREALEVLFISEGDEISKSIQQGLESEPWLRVEGEEGEVFDGKKALHQLVSRDLAGVARLLRQRTEQVVQSHEDAVLAFKIANLIGFYHNTFSKLVGTDSPILDVLAALEESALRQFRANMRDHVASVQSDLAIAPANLAPPDFLDEALEMLKALLKSYDSSMAALDNRENGFQPVLAEALDPFLNGCENLYKRLQEPDNDVFAINCLLAARSVLEDFSFVKERVEEMDGTMREHKSKLVASQHRYFLHTSGLYPLKAILSELSESEEDLKSIPQLPPFKPETLVNAGGQLDDFLPSALMDAMDNIKRLRDARMVQEITEAAAEQFCEDFEFVENRILAADEVRVVENGAEEAPAPSLRDLFPRTSGEIRVLLS